MDPHSLLTVYKASAGSGKTFRLAVRYIAMLVRNPQSYSSILAVTFTNKATAEMKQRILSQLYGIGHGLESSRPYFNEIRSMVPTLTGQTIRYNATLALDLILQDYGHFRVETIDSFFQGILRALARELQLGAGLSVELDTDKVISDAVDDFLADIDPRSQEKRDVMRFIMGNIDNDSNWNIGARLKKFSKELFSEIFMQKGNELKEILKKPDAIRDYQENLVRARDAVLTPLKEQVLKAGQELMAAIAEIGFDVDRLSKNIRTPVQGTVSGIILDKELSKTMTDACTDPSKFFYSADLKARPSLKNYAQDRLCPIFAKVSAIHAEYTRAANSYSSALKYLHELSLLMSIRDRIDSQNMELGRFVLADTVKLLDDLKTSDTSFVFEKTGSFTDNIMIDEFQDTSCLQWKNLHLLLLECLSRGRECLVVGDVKQSIYRWRNSDWNILNTGLEKQLHDYCHVEPMTDNYRSRQSVISFNNRFFTQAVKEMQSYLENVTGQTFPALDKAYSDVEQNCRESGSEGFVSMNIVGNDKPSVICERVADCLDRLTEAGVEQKDIVMLFRYGKEIRTLANWFAENRPEYRMISGEAFRLDSSVSVRIIVATLRWISDRSDKVSLAAMLWEWRGAVAESDAPISDIVASDPERSLPSSLADRWEQLRQIPLYELVEELYLDLELERIEGQDQYVFTFLDTVSNWLKRNRGDIGRFLEDWDDNLHKTPIPAVETDGIRLLTIHKSKGLEFHTVIVPFCDWDITKSGDRLWVEPEEKPFNGIPLLPVGFTSALHTSVFDRHFTLEAGQQAVDNMNLLYVAFTRAAANLIAFSSRPVTSGNSMCNILSDSLKAGGFGTGHTDSGLTFESGAICPSLEKETGTADNPFSFTVLSDKVAMRSLPLHAQFRQSGESVRFTHAVESPEDKREEYIMRGNLLHGLFSTIRTGADVGLQVERLFGEGLIGSRSQADSLKQEIHEHIAKTGVGRWFDGNFRLFNETSILFRDNGVMQKRRPDRVMVMPDGRAVIVDFKFGTEREEHVHQVREYMELLRKMGFDNVEGHIWYVYKDKLTTV